MTAGREDYPFHVRWSSRYVPQSLSLSLTFSWFLVDKECRCCWTRLQESPIDPYNNINVWVYVSDKVSVRMYDVFCVWVTLCSGSGDGSSW